MKRTHKFELPPHLKKEHTKATRLEVITLVYLSTVVAFMYLVAGTSQAMKTAWLEDLLSMIPAICFLVAGRIYEKEANREFAYGYHRAYTVAFLTGSVALVSIGAFLIFDSGITLINGEHATIGTISIFGHSIWQGWLMIAALVYSSVPIIFLGRAKLPLAKKLHNKVLYTDADTQKADWMTGFAAIIGVIGIGMGWWWADSTAAVLISVSVLKDGLMNLTNAVKDIMDTYPKSVEETHFDKLVEEVNEYLKTQAWIERAEVRFRENGQVYFGEVFVIPALEENLTGNIHDTMKAIQQLHWKLHDITIMPVREIPQGHVV